MYPCPECDHGYHYLPTCGHSGSCCPCAVVEVECPACGGTGDRRCEWTMCPEPAMGVTEDDEFFCPAHMAQDARERQEAA